jgi:hypothetical protein
MRIGTGGHLEPTAQLDYCTWSGAEALANAVHEFWSASGYADVLVWIEPARGAQVWAVRSTLRAGLPLRTGSVLLGGLGLIGPSGQR